MNAEVPYMTTVGNLPKILDAIQRAGAPDAFGLDFLKDLGFTSSNDRPVIKLLKYLGLLDSSGKPSNFYREFMDSTRARSVLGARLRSAYDDLFTSDKAANLQGSEKLKGWFKTKTGASEANAQRMASTFKTLATYATFEEGALPPKAVDVKKDPDEEEKISDRNGDKVAGNLGLTFAYRIEVHLPDTTNVDTYRAIFKALKEELG